MWIMSYKLYMSLQWQLSVMQESWRKKI
uniref:Uncharacterized protein n=1 Tax=Arundo donax TaxID=35708 RepID=A0A0A8YVE8_ARUDO